MTDEQRELAEWTAKWAGWNLVGCGPVYCWETPQGTHASPTDTERLLSDDALAFRALVELLDARVWVDLIPGAGRTDIEMWRHSTALNDDGIEKSVVATSPHEAIFRALRAVKEAGGE